jgi:hypothetical protein
MAEQLMAVRQQLNEFIGIVVDIFCHFDFRRRPTAAEWAYIVL